MKNYLWMSSAAVVIGALRVNETAVIVLLTFQVINEAKLF